jgi:hypothetical protein
MGAMLSSPPIPQLAAKRCRRREHAKVRQLVRPLGMATRADNAAFVSHINPGP